MPTPIPGPPPDADAADPDEAAPPTHAGWLLALAVVLNGAAWGIAALLYTVAFGAP